MVTFRFHQFQLLGFVVQTTSDEYSNKLKRMEMWTPSLTSKRYNNVQGRVSKVKNINGQVVAINAVSGKGQPKDEVIMVDPLEAKRLAAKQMEKIKAKEKIKRRHQIEAINGAWAMIGLTAGLVIEGHTGKGILEQLAGYLFAIVHVFVR